MPTVLKSVLVPKPARTMFDLVDDVESYPRFLPWCSGAQVPFAAFTGHLGFVPLGEEGCRMEFALDYSLSSAATSALLGPVLGHIIETLVDRFVARAEALS